VYHAWVRSRLSAGDRSRLRQENFELLNPTTYLLVKLVSIFSLLSMTTFNSDSLVLTMPCLALAPNRLMLAVVSFPRGFETAQMDAATLSQAHLIQPSRALEAEFQVKSSFRMFYSYTCGFVSHQNHQFPALPGRLVEAPQEFEPTVAVYRN
jgi:hypothetical protein